MSGWAMSTRQARFAARLPLVLWPLGIAAEVDRVRLPVPRQRHVTAVDVVNRSVGGSFVACGLIAWQRGATAASAR